MLRSAAGQTEPAAVLENEQKLKNKIKKWPCVELEESY